MNLRHISYSALAVLLIALSILFYGDTIELFPAFIHGWTQSDRYALALAFLDNGMNLFKPQTFNLMTVDGITGVDLPWHEYIIAWIMKITGITATWLFRSYTILFSFIGYLYLYKLARLFNNSSIKSLVLVVFTFTLPVMTYYQAGFVPSAPALSTAFIGLFFYFRYQKSDNTKDFISGLFFILAAALLRSPFNILLFATLLQQALKAFQQKRMYKQEAFAYFAAYSAIFGWHFYKAFLNSKYGSMFLTEIMPAESLTQFGQIVAEVKSRWGLEYFTIGHYLILIVAIVSTFIYLAKKKECDKLKTVLSQQVILLLLGGISFFILMAQQFPAHDYYIIDSLYPGFIMLVLLGITLLPQNKSWLKGVGTFALIGFAVLACAKSISVQQERYAYNFWDRGTITWQNFKGSENLLDSLDISEEAKILVLDAYSTNAPLILMNRRGYTVQNTTRENLQEGLDYPFDYVVVQDIFLPSDVLFNYPELSKHLKRIGGNGKISVYEYTEVPNKYDLQDNLGIHASAEKFPLAFDEDTVILWEYDIETVYNLELDETTGTLNSGNLFGPLFVLNKNPKKDKLLFSAQFKHQTEEVRFEVVATVMQGSEQLYYSSFPVHLKKPGEWKTYNCLFDLPENLPEDIQLKCNIYNPNGAKVEMTDLEVILY